MSNSPQFDMLQKQFAEIFGAHDLLDTKVDAAIDEAKQLLDELELANAPKS